MKSSKLILLSVGLISAALFLGGCGADNWEAGMEKTDEVAVEASSNAKYMNYSKAEYDSLLGKKPFVLYFHAEWCSTCKRLKANMQEDLGELPENTVVLEADYDEQVDLREKYNVLSQTTLVVFDAKGEVVETLTVPSKMQLVAAIEKSMKGVESSKLEEESSNEEASEETAEEEAKTEDAPAEADVEAKVEVEVKAEAKADVETASAELAAPQYLTFSQAKYDELNGKEPHAVYFHAKWCHVCVGLEKNIKSSLSSLPKGTTILQADFDTELKLRKKYNVQAQTTLVLLDKDGNVTDKLLNPSISKLSAALTKSIEA